MAPRGCCGHCDDRNPAYDHVRLCRRCLPETDMSAKPSKNILLRGYVVLVFIFVFTPILTSFVFSVNSDRFPTIPLGHFTTHWYETILADPDVWDAFRVSGIVSITVAILATFIGFCTAYTDYRYNFTGKAFYLCLLYTSPSPRDRG